jgi:signal transduction histidine kinase
VRRSPSLPVLATAALVAVVQVVGSIGATNGQTDRRSLDALAVALLLVGPAALAVRERWPHGAALVAIAATAVFLGRGHAYGPVFASPLVAMVTAGLTPRRGRTWLVGVAAVVAILVAQLVDPNRNGGVPWVHLGLVTGWVTAVLAATEVTRNRRDQAAERARAAADEDRRKAGEQRLRIAQELHDVLAHDISLINVQAGVALHLVDEQPEQARTALANIKEASRDALHELRSALDVLRTGDDAPRAPAPRLDALPALVEGVRASGIEVHLELPALPTLPASVELAAYRIVQEALTNVTRHARATSAAVVLHVDDGLVVEVTDDGVGGPATPGNGITGMRERATSLGGSLEAGPVPGGGFRVSARLPT